MLCKKTIEAFTIKTIHPQSLITGKEKLLESKSTSQSKQQEEVFRSSTETELTNVKELKSKLTKKVNKFTSGSIGNHIATWQALMIKIFCLLSLVYL